MRETRSVALRCPKGHVEIEVTVTAAVIDSDLGGFGPGRGSRPSAPVASPEDFIELGPDDECPVCEETFEGEYD